MIGNPVKVVRSGKMVLSDLNQIKKNERDRRRRLRLEQVRQQSKEISNRLLERAKRIAREELNKLEKDEKSELRRMHNKKIIDMQHKYQEDLEDIGQAHVSAALQPIADIIIQEEEKKNRTMALKRGKDAIERMKETKQTDGTEETHQERLRKVREIENIRAAMIAKLPKSLLEEDDTTERNPSQNTNKEIAHEVLTPTKKNKKILPKKTPKKTKKSNIKEHQVMSPKPGPSGLQKKSSEESQELSSRKKTDKFVSDHMEHVDDASDDQVPRKTVPTMNAMPTKLDKKTKYDPKDYRQDTSSSNISSSSSDDSSYFSDAIEQIICDKSPRTPVSTENKVRSQYSRDTQKKYTCNKPHGLVERIDIRNEPSAIEVAQAMKNAEKVQASMSKTRKLNAQRRGEDAILREKVRRDYQMLLQNLDHLAQEERKLKASQIQSVEEDTYMRPHQRNKCQEEREKKLNRAAKKVFNTDNTLTQCTNLTDRVITLPTQKKDNNVVPHSTWQNSYLVEEQPDVCCAQQDKDSEISREEQILDMLRKIERQKRLLLQEFGANLPDNIFNASMKPLFEDKMPVKTPETDTAKILSPEIKVINMSSDECIRETRKVKKPVKLPEKVEIAVQTVLEQSVPAENKSVQVKLPEKDIPHSSRDTITQVPHPIEPKVTVITHESDNSSNNDSNSSSNNSTNSENGGLIIEIDKKEVIVTPKKKKSSVKISKRSSPRIYQKIRSVSSKATSPTKRFLKSQSNSRLTPQKKTRCLDMPDTAARKVDIHLSESTQVDETETDPSQETRLSIDASAESSQTYSGMNDQDQSSGKPYRIRTQTKRWIRIKDTSDTSTSFASPPPVKPRSMLEALSNVTPILEMLESSAPGFEELKRLQQDISPVSTPETPSPRTMMMPSNIPHRDRISRMLRFSLNDSQANNSVMSSTQKDQSTLTDPSDVYQKSESSKQMPTVSQQSSSEDCICKNPQCKLLHIKLDDVHDYALKNCPEILQKYEELQNLCSERIASLTNLIEKVRNEQKDIDISLISQSDDTSLMQLSTPKPAHTDAHAVRKLIDSIEAIHAQLARTLLESQRIMRGNETMSRDETSCDAEVQAITSTPISKLIDTIKTHVDESKVVKDKPKPKIISNEKVNIQLSRFKIQQKPQAVSTMKTPEHKSWLPHTLPLHEEEIIEKLSKEILEQSNSLDKASTAFVTLKENDEIQHKISFKESNQKKNALGHEKDGSVISISETTRENDFTPILTGIPKILRNHGTSRPKPPVTLLNGLYRPELEGSSGHELSTIIEFDTTDTVNKSSKSPTKSKPSVHVAPLPIQQNQNSTKKSTDSSSNIKHSVEKLSFAQKSQETTTTHDSSEKSKNVTDCITETKMEAEREYILEKCNKQLQCNTTTEELASQIKDKLGSSISTDFNLHKESRHRTTSTSLYSFSGLSGISEITSSPSSDMLKQNSSPEEMETALKKLGLSWAVTTLKKTREASALSSSSNSDVTPINTARKMISPTKKQHESNGFPEISDVSSISIKEASKSTEQAVLLKGRTSTPKFQNSNSSERSSTINTTESIQDPSDSLTVPNMSLMKTKSDKQLQSP